MQEQHTIRVDLPPLPYEIVVRPELLRDLADILAPLGIAERVCIVTDSHVAPLHLQTLIAGLRARFQIAHCILPAGEENKTLAGISKIYDAFLPLGIDRKTALLALGGGVVGDMTGFAAATILRGVPFIQVPTTLLSMVDASVGGKTGVDHPCGKNLIGAFHQPRIVCADPTLLTTLPTRELVGGLAECIKHDVIRDAGHFDRLPTVLAAVRALDVQALADLVAHNVQIKARVVEEDPLEKSVRAHLNFGHTFAHPFETLSQYTWSHGEAVGLGMIAASRMARDLGMIAAGDVERIEAVIAAAGLPVGGLSLDPAECVRAMAYDKKVAGKKIRFVLPDRIGHVVIRDDIPTAAVEQAIASLM